MQVAISLINVNERVRKDMGDLKELKESLQAVGQLTPVVLTKQYELIAGHRRLLAARELGWKTIDAVLVDRESEADKLQMELDENVQRKDFSTDELVDGYRRLAELRKPSLGRRIGKFFKGIAGFLARPFRRRKEDRGPEPIGLTTDEQSDQSLGV